MRTVDSILTNFTAGELSPNMYGRTDIEKYYNGCMTMENFLVLPQWGAYRRPGSRYVASVKTASAFTRLVPFIFSTTQSYILEFGNLYMRVYYDGGQVQSGSTVYEVVTPYTTAQLPDLKFAQSADTLYIVHPSHEPRQLTRTAHTTWTLTALAWENGPFMKDNDDDSHTLTVTSYGGSTGLYGQTVTVTSSADLFTSADVGRWIKIRYNQESSKISSGKTNPAGAGVIGGPWSVDGAWTITANFDSGAQANLRVAIQYSIDGGTTWQEYDAFLNVHGTASVTKEGELRSEDYNNVIPRIRLYADGDINEFRWVLRYARESVNGMLKITTYSTAKSVRAKVYRKMSQFNVPTNNWALGAWGTTPGWPKTGGFGNGRLWLAGTPEEPQTIWGSKTQDYVDFSTSLPLVDDDAVNATLDSAKMNAIEHIVAMNDLIVMTSGSVWRVSGGSDDVITPSSIMARFQEGRGANKVQPIVIGNSILFCARKGNTIRELAYTYEKDVFTSLNRSILSQHYFDGYTIIDMAYQQEPWSVVWMVRDDGKLLSFTYLQEHEVFAWTEHTVAGTGAEVESVCVIPGTDEDEVWIVVKRTVNSATVRYIERLHTRDFGDDLEDAFFVDSGLTYDGAAATTISGLSHLEGQTVAVLADGEYIGTKTVASGQITLTTAASVVQVGLPYDSVVETLGIEVQTNNGTIITRPKLVNTVWVSVYETQGIQVGPNADRLKNLPDCANDLYTGDARILMDTGWEQNGRIYIKQSKHLPMEILAITPQLDAGRK